MEGFNRLLEDVYGKELWLSHLLIKQGASPEQITRWRHDGLWLLGFLSRLEQRLLADLKKRMPQYDPRVLSYWYGLSVPEARSVRKIADELRISSSEVGTIHNALLEYLRGKVGRMALEKAVIIATQGSDYESTAHHRE